MFCGLEGSTSEDIRLLLEGSSYKHEPTKFSGMVFAHRLKIYAFLDWECYTNFPSVFSEQVNVRSFGHRNPLEEYKIDGCKFFISMLSATRRLTVESLLRYWSSPMESQELYV